MTRTLDRRAFLLGRAAVPDSVPALASAPVRPPWALPEPGFRDACERCDDCVRACEEGIIFRGPDGYPEVSFAAGGCTLCADCVAACNARALTGDTERESPWAHRVAIGAGCLSRVGVECRSCGEACDSAAIRFRPRVGGPAWPDLDIGCCTGCGQCLPRCPVGAIEIVREPQLAAENNR